MTKPQPQFREALSGLNLHAPAARILCTDKLELNRLARLQIEGPLINAIEGKGVCFPIKIRGQRWCRGSALNRCSGHALSEPQPPRAPDVGFRYCKTTEQHFAGALPGIEAHHVGLVCLRADLGRGCMFGRVRDHPWQTARIAKF